MKRSQIRYWATRLISAGIMMQTLFYKFTGAAESVAIFSMIGMEPWGRIAIGIAELVAALLLLINTTAWLGAAMAVMLMLGALLIHILVLGISVRGDGGLLFTYAVVVLLCSLYVLHRNKEKIMHYSRTSRDSKA